MVTTGLSSFITILPTKVKVVQQATHHNINNSPRPTFPWKITCRSPLEITISAPDKEIIIPVSLYLLNFSLNIKLESKAVKADLKMQLLKPG